MGYWDDRHHPQAQAATFAAQAKTFAARFASKAADYDRTGAAPLEYFEALFPTGILSLVVNRKDGGFNGGLAEAQAVVREIGVVEPATSLILAMHYAIHAAVARRIGWPEPLAKKLTEEPLSRIALVNALQLEPKAGSPPRGGLPDTLARRSATGWSISGHKLYSIASPILTWAVVLARTDEPEPRVGSFLVPTKVQGFRIVETWNPVGMRATASHDVIF